MDPRAFSIFINGGSNPVGTDHEGIPLKSFHPFNGMDPHLLQAGHHLGVVDQRTNRRHLPLGLPSRIIGGLDRTLHAETESGLGGKKNFHHRFSGSFSRTTFRTRSTTSSRVIDVVSISRASSALRRGASMRLLSL